MDNANGDTDQKNEKDGLIELPGYFEDIPLDDLVVLIADLLQRMIAHNDQIPLSAAGLTRFHSRSTPAISVIEYLRRIVKYVRVERSVLLLMLHSIDQVCTRRPSFNISSLSVHRFIIAAITVLSKAFCDAFSPNPLFAKVGGVSLIELNLLEKEFLSAMDWRLACTREVLHYYYVKLVRTHSSGNYIVPDTSPRPAPIDTLPSDEIEWNELSRSPSSLANMKGTKKGDVSDGSLSGGHASSISMDEGTESDSSDEDGSSQMVTSMRSPHRLLSRGTSQNNSPALSTSSSKRAYRQTLPKSGFAGSATSSSATVEQSVAFSEMRSTSHHHRLSNSSSPLQGPSAMSGISTVSAPRSPATSFRSPVVGRRRRRSTTQMNAPSVASTLLSVDAPDPAVLEGLIRGSSRRRLHMDGNDTRLEVEPSTPR